LGLNVQEIIRHIARLREEAVKCTERADISSNGPTTHSQSSDLSSIDLLATMCERPGHSLPMRDIDEFGQYNCTHFGNPYYDTGRGAVGPGMSWHQLFENRL